MLFKDGNKIDLRIEVKDVALERYLSDTLTQNLSDKDDFLPEIFPSSDMTHWIKLPTKEMFLIVAMNDNFTIYTGMWGKYFIKYMHSSTQLKAEKEINIIF